MTKLGVKRFVVPKQLADTREVLDDTAKRYQQRHDVGGLHKLQRRELHRRYFAVRHGSRWQYRKHVIYSWSSLYDHEKSASPRQGVVWHRQGDSELASTRESGPALTSIILSFLSCASPWKSTEKDTKELHTKSRRSNLDVKISNEDEQSGFARMPTPGMNISLGYNSLMIQESNPNITHPIDTQQAMRLEYTQELLKKEIGEVATSVLQSKNSDRFAYVAIKETNQTEDGIRRDLWGTLRISKSFSADQANKNGSNKEVEEPSREEEPIISFLNDTSVEGNTSTLLNVARNNTLQKVKSFQQRNNDTIVFSMMNEYLGDEISSRTSNVIVEAHAEKIQTFENRADQKNWGSQEDDLMKAASFGLQAMHDLYHIQEPKLYSMGLYLEKENPARYVAAFNDQSEEARDLARFGYAALQATTMLLKKFPNAPLELPLSRSTQKTPLEQQCPRRNPPRCPPASLRYRTSDGSCNNLQNLWWGSAMSTMRRYLPPEYHDGIQSVRRSRNGRRLPDARDVTDSIHEDRDIPLASVTHMLMQWGQFIDHDLTATGQSRGFNGTVPQCCLQRGIGFQPPEFMHPECLPIAVSPHDSFYGPLGVRCLEFLRSGPAPKENCEFGPREQLTQVTSFLDASMVYSSNAMHSDSLRIFRNGLLQYGRIQSRRPLLPKLESDLCKRGSLSTTCFRAGDGRLSEQPALTSLHIVFLRLHNRIATELSSLNSHWSDEKLFQETRRIIGAMIQHITYREFLPIILGPQVIKIFDLEVLKKGYYEGYDPSVNPTVANSFSTAAYRFGHSLVQRSFVRFDSNHRPVFNNVSIHEEFSNPANLETAGSVDRLLLGLVNQPCQRRDEFISDEMTNHLFQTPAFSFGMDLASLNIQRGRDHGLPAYVRWREPCGLSPIRTFNDLNKVMSPSVVRKFRSLYSSVNDIDLFPAGLAEKSVVGGLVGPTFACIIGQQFSNLRRGDRFWYENPESESSFTAGQLQQIRQATLAQILCHTMDGIKTIQPFVFLAADTLKNQRLSCDDPILEHLNLKFWIERPSEFRSARRFDRSQKIQRTMSNDPVLPEKRENISPRKRVTSQQEQTKIALQKPLRSSINQNNRIVVKRPLGRPDNNVTIVVQNNAVNSPVFVNDGIYDSHIRIHQQPVGKQPIANLNPVAASNYLVHQPIPTTIPQLMSSYAGRPYRPYAYDDPNNPNPLVYGYRSPVSTQDDIFYDNYSLSSPRPTLYTYYTNLQQKQSTTQLPNRDINDYSTYYGFPHHGSFVTQVHERPKPSANSGYYHESDDKQTAMQEPNDSQLPSYTRPNYRPNYASNNFKPFHEQKPDYDTSKPPDDGLHHQKPIYDVSAPPTSLRPPFKPNYQSQVAQQADTAGHLQSNHFDDGDNGSYLGNPNKPLHQEEWNSNNYQKRPSERPYDQDDPDAYQKRPDIQAPSYSTTTQTILINRPDNGYNSQSWKTNSPDSVQNPKDSVQNALYGSVPNFATANTPPYEKDITLKSKVHPNISSNNYNSYSGTTPIYQKISIPTQNSSTSASTYIKKSSTSSLPPNNESFNPHIPLFYQKLTNHSVAYQKDDQSQLPSYPNESIDRPLIIDPRERDDSYKSPTQSFSLNNQASSVFYQDKDQSTPMSYMSANDMTTDFQIGAHTRKPTKIQSVTVVTETIEAVRHPEQTIETVHHPGHSGYISQHRVTSEIPKPLLQQMTSNTPVIRRPGQYYYEKNVLHRYPDEIQISQIAKNNHYSAVEFREATIQDRGTIVSDKIAAETSVIEDPITNSKVIQNNKGKLTTTSMIVINDNGGDTVRNLQRAFLAENVAEADIPNRSRWINPQEDLNLASISEMPGIPFNEFASARELPKPIRLREHAS